MKAKFFLPGLVLAFGIALTGCGGNNDAPAQTVETPTVTETPTQTPAETPAAEEDTPSRDLGGVELIIANWWGSYDTDTFVPDTAEQEAVLEARIAAEQRYNFRMREVNVGGWDDFQELVALSILADDPVGHIIMLEPQWFAALRPQGLFAPLNNHVNFNDRSAISWHGPSIELATSGGNQYGFAIGYIIGGGIYFNQRLFEEAGLDPELPFDLQLSGEWTWDRFLEIAHQLTRDTDNTGVADTWALASFSNDILTRAVASNNAAFVSLDAQGNFVNTTNTLEFLEALTFVNALEDEGVMMPQPEGSEWNWFNEAFWNANVAMRTGGHYMAGSHINENLNDPWGFVSFPMGPNASNYVFMGNQNITVVPSSFSTQEVDDIMFAYQLWMTTPEDFRDPDAWMFANFPNHPNPRSVEESMALFMRNPDLGVPLLHGLVPGLQIGDISWEMWHGNDPAAIVEAVQQSWNETIGQMN